MYLQERKNIHPTRKMSKAPMTTPRRSFYPAFVCSVAAAILLSNSQESAAFHGSAVVWKRRGFHTHTHPSPSTSMSSFQSMTTTRKRPSTDLSLAIPLELDGPAQALSEFFRTQPFLAAFMTCSVKASAADLLAQTSSSTSTSNNNEEEEQEKTKKMIPAKKKKRTESSSTSSSTLSNKKTKQDSPVNVHRNLAFLLYGGLYQGMFLQFLYMAVYPALYGDSPYRIVASVFTDTCVFGPFVTLPIAYIIRAVIESNATTGDNEHKHEHTLSSLIQPIEQGIDKYKNHVLTQGLLYTYWMIWAPAQTLNHGFVPEHLRVFFVAFVSFFWVYLLSGISSQQEQPEPTGQTA
jgi:hypothetical protein